MKTFNDFIMEAKGDGKWKLTKQGSMPMLVHSDGRKLIQVTPDETKRDNFVFIVDNKVTKEAGFLSTARRLGVGEIPTEVYRPFLKKSEDFWDSKKIYPKEL